MMVCERLVAGLVLCATLCAALLALCAALLDARSMDTPSRGLSVQDYHRKAPFPDAQSTR